MTDSEQYRGQYRQQLTGLEVAVIGMALRFPGASDIDAFLENLRNGVESVRFFTDEELKDAGVEPGLLEDPNYVRAKAVVDNAEHFDAGFFGYTPAEAAVMDPQIRLFHQCTWHALEHAGYEPGTYDGLIGLYAGASLNQYWQVLSMLVGDSTGLDSFSAYQLTNKDNLTTRVSYNLDLKGPSYAIQTACSTSLVAVHVACQSLLSGECNIALAGGVTVTFPRSGGYIYHEGMVSSPDGHCRAFDAQARGTVGGEGCGVVVLKLLEEALEDGDTIHAVIKGSAINNDGRRKTGYTAPSVRGQINVIQAALKMAEVDATSIGYVEAHGTATSLGDPIEVEALTRAFDTPERQFCGLGSVKSNFGHLDSAAGIAGFIKAVLSIKEKVLFPSLYFSTPNPQIKFQESPFFVPTQAMPWRTSGTRYRAGVSSFGIGGTNAHVILEAAPEFDPQPLDTKLVHNPLYLFTLSARSPESLSKASRNLAEHFSQNPELSPGDAAYTLQVGRRAMPYRAMTVATSLAEAGHRLGQSQPGKMRYYRAHSRAKVIFMFPGLGGQYLNMAAGLYRREAVFREEMDRCFAEFQSLTGKDLKALLYPNADSNVENGEHSDWEHDIVQPLIFSIEYALARLLMQWGIKPHAMIGYSFGEYAAAAVSGVFSMEDALKIIVERGRLVSRLPRGAMSSVPLPLNELEPLLAQPEFSSLSIAIDNGSSCIISGPVDSVSAFEQSLKQRRLLCMRLPNASHALHSPAMEPILPSFESLLRKVTLEKPQIPYISNVSGDWISEEEAMDPLYWCNHLSGLVKFHQGIQTLTAIPGALFVEVGPGGDITTMIKRYIDEADEHGSRAVSLIRNPARRDDDVQFLYRRLGFLWCRGVVIDWNAFYGQEKPRRVPLPAYPFEEQYYTPDPGGKLMKTILTLGSQLQANGLTQDIKLELPERTERETERGQTERGQAAERPFDADTPFVPPTGPVQHTLATIWETFFGIRSVGIKDDFFQLGGDSLKAMNVSNLIERELNLDIPVAEFFKRRTIENLAAYIAGLSVNSEKSEKSGGFELAPVEDQEYYPLSAAQERLFVLHRLAPEDTGYNETLAFLLEGGLDIPRFETTLKKLIQRHESLRTSFPIIDGDPVQRVHKEVPFQLELIGPMGPIGPIEIVSRPFDLALAPLFRVGLGELGEDRYVVFMVTHHIISDGTSQTILMEEFMTLYNGGELPPQRIQYRDYACLEPRLLAARNIDDQETWWLSRFSGELPVLEPPLDFPRPVMMEFEGNEVRDVLDVEMTGALNNLASSGQSTLFMVLLTAYTMLLSRLTGQQDIVTGTPVAGRRHAGLSNVFGMFVNTLALRNRPVAGKTLKDYLSEVTTDTLAAFENQDYPFESLVDRVVKNRDTSRNPLFDTMLVLQNMDTAAKEVPGLKMSPYIFEKSISKFDLALTVYEIGDRLELALEYRTRLFREETVKRFLDYFRRILTVITADPEIVIAEIGMLPESEKELLLNRFNDTGWDYPQQKPMNRCFEEQAGRTPDRVAIVDSSNLYLSYHELNTRAGSLAREFKKIGLSPNSPNSIVALKTQRSAAIIIQILAAWKAGAAYLPIDPDWPEDRIQYILKDSNAILLPQTLPNNLPSNLQQFAQQSRTPVQSPLERGAPKGWGVSHSETAAYIIYTSGSTGSPKGVIIQHRSAVNLTLGYQRRVYAQYNKVLNNGLISPFFFDPSVLHSWATLLSGHTLFIVPPESRADGIKLKSYISRHNLDTIEGSPGHLSLMLESTPGELYFPGLKQFAVGGEALPGPLVTRFFSRFNRETPDLINLYGPTECTVAATAHTISGAAHVDHTVVPIGTPLQNVSIFILGKRFQLQPIGVTGELCIAGPGLARGYLNNPELTAQKFIPIKLKKSSLVYRTGDLACWQPDGTIQFKGRIDEQVKIRGYRVEPGEIRHVLQEHPAVGDAVVTVQTGGDGHGEKYLCAYVAPRDKESFEKSGAFQSIKQWLAQKLPAYMVPAFITVLDSVPLTPQGKTDYKALPRPGARQEAHLFTAPRNAEETLLATIWQEVLDYSPVGIDDDFFQRGGHSLKATRLTAKIQRSFQVNLPLGDVFRCPTIRQLAAVIQEKAGTGYYSIEPVETRSYYPCSPAQGRLFILQQMDPQSTVYNISSPLVLQGEVDKDRLEQSFREVIARHESLRTSFHLISGQPVQKIHQEVLFSIGPIGPIGPIKELIRPFDLAVAPLLRVELREMDGSEQFLLLVDMHHIISDGVSTDILIRDFIAAYSGEVLEPLELQYKDIAAWQRGSERREQLKRQERYWRDVFDENEEVPVLQLPYDFPRPPIQDFRGALYQFGLDAAQSEALNRLASFHGATLYMVLMALFNVLLSRLSNQQDIVVGTPVAGRTHEALEPVIGMFINTLAMRYGPDGEKDFSGFLDQVKSLTLQAFENQDYPFEQLVEKAAVNRDAGRNPLFDVMFVLQNMEIRDIELPGMTLRPYEFDPGVARFDLTMTCTPSSDGLGFMVEYCSGLFKPETIERFSGYFKRIAQAVSENPEVLLSRIPLIDETERRRLLLDFNGTAAEYPEDKTVHQMFEEQAARTPDRTAVIASITGNRTYKQLNFQADEVAGSLTGNGARPGDIIAIMMERSPDMVVNILAVLKAGCAYMPIDPDYPESRRQFMLRDSHVAICLDHKTYRSYRSNRSYSNNAQPVQPSSGAYVIYTSGTTGQPKGTIVEHRNVVRLMFNSRFQFDFNENDRWTLFHSFCFDFSVWEMYGALLRGGSLVIVPGPVTRDPVLFLDLLARQGVSVLNQTPAAFYHLMAEALKPSAPLLRLRYIIFGGDALRPVRLKQWRTRYPLTKLINMYGITETTVHVTYKEIMEPEIESNISAIGAPIPTLTCYIVDRHLELQPLGVPGELLVGGEGVARGYLNRPELTAEKFVPVTFTVQRSPFTVYRSGDLARRLSGGEMEYLGRIDQQVKIRGFRVELGEIESQLLDHPDVSETVVIYNNADKKRDAYLCAYVVLSATAGTEDFSGILREHLKGRVPAYMAPSYFMILEQIPLTANGKIDRKALPQPDFSGPASGDAVETLSGIEKELAHIWSEVLEINVERIAGDADFFQLGGHSLKAIQAVNAIHAALDIRLPVQALFQFPTISLLAAEIRQRETTTFRHIVKQADRPYYEMSYSQRRLWVLQRKKPDSPAFNMPESITLPGRVDTELIRRALRVLIQRHDALRTCFRELEGDTVQWVETPESVAVPLETVDLSMYDGEALNRERACVFARERETPFDIEKAPLLRVTQVNYSASGKEATDIIYNMHHLVSDGWSLEIFKREFILLYETLENNDTPQMDEPVLHYRDFAVWHNQLLEDSVRMEPVLSFWRQRMKTQAVPVDLPYDSPLTQDTGPSGAGYRVRVSSELTDRLRSLAGQYQTTLFTVLLAAFNVLLGSLRGQADLVVAFPGAARPHRDLDGVIGLFVNTLLLRTEISWDEPFETFMARVRDDVMRVLEYQDIPMELVFDRIETKYPEVTVFFNMQNTGDSHKAELEEFDAAHFQHLQDAKFPLVFYVMEFKNGMNLMCHYFKEVFEPGTVEKIVNMYLRLLEKITRDPGQVLRFYKTSKKRRKISRS